MMKGITLAICFCVFTIFATATSAQTADGLPPSEEDVCDGFIGQAFGLCNAYCEAMDCDSDEPNANEKACGKVSDTFMSQTGQMPPCEVSVSCPCFTSEDLQADIYECGDDFFGFPGLAGIIFVDGRVACSGLNCVNASDEPGCAITKPGGELVFMESISDEDNEGCQTLILASCDTSPNVAQSATASGAEQVSSIPFIFK